MTAHIPTGCSHTIPVEEMLEKKEEKKKKNKRSCTPSQYWHNTPFPAEAVRLEGFLEATRGVDRRRLIIEITETAMLSIVESTAGELLRLRDLGVGIHVDDFGTGFSSISILRDLPVTGLKLDLSFVRNLTSGDSPSNALAQGLAGLAQGLQLVGIAEGVERPEQARLLAEQGWTHGQGYLFGRPQPL